MHKRRKSFNVICNFFNALDRVINSVLGPASPFFTFLPIRESKRLAPNLDVTLVLTAAFLFFFPSTRAPMVMADALRQ